VSVRAALVADVVLWLTGTVLGLVTAAAMPYRLSTRLARRCLRRLAQANRAADGQRGDRSTARRAHARRSAAADAAARL
jgi:hypothetical protein